MSGGLVLAAVRDDVAEFVGALFLVYGLIIFIYVLTSLIFALGVRTPYSRAFDVFMTFLRDVSEPYLRIFRRFIPMIGPLDLSPIVALIVLQIVGGIVVRLIQG